MRTSGRTFLCLILLCACVPSAAIRKEVAENEAAAVAEDAATAAVAETEAVRRIREVQDARGDATSLLPWRRHPAAGVRAALLRAWALIGDGASFGPVGAGLGDPVPEVRREAAFALGQVPVWELADAERVAKMQEAEELLLDALGRARRPAGLRSGAPAADTLPSEGAVLLRALGEVAGEPGWDALIDGLRVGRFAGDEVESALNALSMMARRNAGRALDLAALQAMLPHLLVEDDPAGWAVAALLARVRIGDDAREAVIRALADVVTRAQEPDRRAWAARALGKVGATEAWASLRALLRAPGAPMREKVGAIRGLSAAKDDEGLAVALHDPDPLVSEEAALGLGGIGTSGALRALLGWVPVGAELEAVRLGALGAVLGNKDLDTALVAEALVLLTVQVGVPDPQLRAAAADALGNHPDPASADLLLARTTVEAEPKVRLQIAGALGRRSETQVEGTLLAWLVDTDTIVAGTAAEGLAKHPGEAVRARLREALAIDRGAGDADRRIAIATALLGRDDLEPTDMTRAGEDQDPDIRRLAWRELVKRQQSAGPAAAPLPRSVIAWPDALFGVGSVTGARIETSKGVLGVALRPDQAPTTVANFVRLAEAGTYDGLPFHRVVADFVVQGGDPRGDGSGGPGWRIRCELSPLPYRRGAMGMALSGKDTGGSQWFLTLSQHPHLDGHYTVFGQLQSGWDVLDRMRRGDRIERVTIVRKGP